MVNHQGTPSRDSEVGIWEPLTDAGHEYLSRFCQSYALMSIKSWREPGLGVAIVMNFKPSINLVKGHYFVTIRLQKGTLDFKSSSLGCPDSPNRLLLSRR